MTASLQFQTYDSVWNKLCFFSWFTDCCCEGALAEPLFLRGFIAWRRAGRSEVSGSADVRGHDESRLVPLVKQRLFSCWARSLWTVTKVRFSSVRRRNSSSRRAISMATFSSSTSSASNLRLKRNSFNRWDLITKVLRSSKSALWFYSWICISFYLSLFYLFTTLFLPTSECIWPLSSLSWLLSFLGCLSKFLYSRTRRTSQTSSDN